MPGSTAQTNKFHTFYLQQRPDNGDTWADIKVNHPLDYESIKEYNLTIRVEVRTFLFFFFLNIFQFIDFDWTKFMSRKIGLLGKFNISIFIFIQIEGVTVFRARDFTI